ncbi:MAG: GNAT family N-acetyltransferase [Burkholderiaceae bacterium]|jgi:RimJ/RimL family protein N-acetyltransferase|nr:GNAT family N-acetyltransferase [Burkholderiaceae bacterium]
METFTDSLIERERVPVAASQQTARKPAALVPIREIGPRYREHIARHILALDARDRYLRFGHAAGDEQIRRYVESIDFKRDDVFGIFNRELELIAVAHLAYPPEMAQAQDSRAEFGVSVSGHARGRGYGARLFERAATRAVNHGMKTLYIHALSENTVMLHIARKAGARVERDGSESQAWLSLPAGNFRTWLSELLTERVGRADHWLKREAARARDALEIVQEIGDGVREAAAARQRTGS